MAWILQEIDADLTLLQEVDVDSGRSFYVNQLECYAGAFSEQEIYYAPNYRCVFIPYPLPCIGRVEAGLVTIGRYEPVSAERIALPTPYRWPMRIGQLKRCLLVERIALADSEKELVLVNLHLEAYDKGEGKAAQTKQLYDFLNEEYEKGNYCIAGGDFNQTFENVDENLYPLKQTKHFVPGTLTLQGLGEGWQMANDAAVPTSRLLNEPYDPASENTQYYVIDGFLVSPNVEVNSVETLDGGFTYTDHNPVLMEVTLK